MSNSSKNWLVAFCLIPVCGCFDSKNPLSDPNKAKIHAEILGVWVWASSGVHDDEWTIAAAGEGFPEGMLRITAIDEGTTETLFAFSTKLADNYYLNVVNFKDHVVPARWDRKLIDDYTVMPYRISENTFTGTMLNEAVLTEAIRNRKLAGRLTQQQTENAHLSASTEELQAYFTKEHALLLDDHTETGFRKGNVKDSETIQVE